MFVILIVVIFALFFYIKCVRPYQQWQRLKIPHVKSVPIFGNMAKFLFKKQTFPEWVEEIYNSHDTRYIGLFQLNIPTLMLKDINLIKQIGIKDFDHFVDHRSFITQDIDPLFGRNLFSLTGQEWRKMRVTLSPAFTGSKMRSMFVLMSECAEDFTKYFQKSIETKKPIVVEMRDIFQRFSNDVIATTAFGIKCDSLNDKNNEFYTRGKEVTEFTGIRLVKFAGYVLSKTLMKVLGIQFIAEDTRQFYRDIVVNNMKIREENGIVRPDMIHLLMEARKGKLKHEEIKEESAGFAAVEESENGRDIHQAKLDLSDDDITAQALLFFIAGFDTISTAMCHMAYELALNEDIQKKLQEEIDLTMKECEDKITYENITKMTYLDMVVCEVLRKWPPGSVVDRVCLDSYTIPAENPNEIPVTLKKNDLVWFPIYALHRDPKYFSNPSKFDPERFSDKNKGNIKPFSYIPFGVGPRNCIGSRFALLQAKVAFVYLLSKFSLEICEKSEVPLKLTRGQFNITAENGFWLRMKLRE